MYPFYTTVAAVLPRRVDGIMGGITASEGKKERDVKEVMRLDGGRWRAVCAQLSLFI